MDITKFNEKLNRLDGNIYTVEEVVTPVNGIYEAPLIHDNVEKSTINVYTGSKLTGNKINTIALSTPSLTPWKTVIKIFSTEPVLYISYETTGDQVEAEDINNLQDAVNETQNELNKEVDRAIKKENEIEKNLDNEITRAKAAEKTLTDNLSTEVTRAKAAEKVLTDSLNTEINRAKKAESDETTRAKGAEKVLTDNLTSEVQRATGVEKVLTDNLNTTNTNLANEVTRAKNAEGTLSTNLANEVTRATNAEIAINNIINTNKPLWDDKYTKNEINNKISQVITDLDWKESVATYNDLSTTYPNPQDGWTVNVKDTDITYRWSGTAWIAISANSIPLATASVDGKMSKQDKADHDDMVAKRHTHDNKSVLDGITSALITAWNNAVTHISDTVKHITTSERTNWNDANSKKHEHSNKSVLDTITSALISNWNSAFTHIADTIKHITSAERTLWNTVSNKLDATANAVSASKLQTARTINGVSFDGSKNITIADNTKMPITRITTAKDFNTLTSTGIYIIKVNNCTNTPTGNWGTLYVSNEGTLFQLYIPDNSYAEYKRVYNSNTSQWSSWTNLISKSAVGLGNVDNTSDLNKPISTATQKSLDEKSDKTHAHTGLTYNNLTDKTIDLNTIKNSDDSLKYSVYRCMSTSGSGNISNKPCADGAFILEVQGIRYITATDYITKQIFTSIITQITYERYCTNGTWTSWEQIYSSGNKPKLSQLTNDAGFITASDVDTSQNHIHSNKSILDKITQALLDAWSSKAAGNHTHNYAGSSSAGGSATTALACTGNSATATKLATARTIALSGDASGSASFDGSGNSTISATVRRTAMIGSDVDGTNGWYKVAEQTCSSYGNQNITFMVTSTYGGANFGILQLQIRSDNTSIYCSKFGWLSRVGFDVNNFIIVVSGMKWTLYANRTSTRYGRIAFEILSAFSIDRKWDAWSLTFKDNSTKETVTPTATTKSSDIATVNYSNASTKATQDSDGKQINTTYVKKGMTWNELEGV